MNSTWFVALSTQGMLKGLEKFSKLCIKAIYSTHLRLVLIVVLVRSMFATFWVKIDEYNPRKPKSE